MIKIFSNKHIKKVLIKILKKEKKKNKYFKS